MKIEPVYVTFEQAKWLKEKEFDEICNSKFCAKGNVYPMTQPILNEIKRPEQWQVVEWLRVKHGIWVQTPYSYIDGIVYCWTINKIDEIESDRNCWLSGIDTEVVGFDTPQEAYSAAFDYIKNNNWI